MDDWRHEEALFRYGLIAAALDARISPAERGALVRALALRLHAHPSGDLRRVGRSTLDDWIRAYRRGGFAALVPEAARVGAAHAERAVGSGGGAQTREPQAHVRADRADHRHGQRRPTARR